MGLADELGWQEGFHSLEHEALMNVYFTGALIRKRATEFFRDFGLTDVQFNVLMLLAHQSGDQGGLSQVDLSRMMLVNRANITSLVDRMEKGGLVARTPVAGDRRFNRIKLTARGKRLLTGVQEQYEDEVRRIMGSVDQKGLKGLVKHLETVRGRLNPS